MTTPKAKLAGLALIAVLVLLPCTSTAQQETEEPPAALEQSQGTAVEAPAPQSETPKPSAQQEPPAAQPLSAAPVQSARPAEKPCGPHCQAAEQREKDDLEAQQDMALWAMRMFWGTFASILVAATAVVLVFFTLREARKTTAVAQNTFEASSRPWISVEVNIRSDLTWKKDEFVHAQIRVIYRNFGNAPAINAYVRSQIRFWDVARNNPIEEQRAFSEKERRNPFPAHATNIFPGDTMTTDVNTHTDPEQLNEIMGSFLSKNTKPEDRTIGICVIGCVQYWSPSSIEPKQTGFIFEFVTPNIAGYPAPFAFRINKDVRLADLQLLPHTFGAGIVD